MGIMGEGRRSVRRRRGREEELDGGDNKERRSGGLRCGRRRRPSLSRLAETEAG